MTLNEPRYIDFGLELVAGCRDTYTQTATGIGPETFQWLGENSPANATVPAGNESFYDRAGFYITNAHYITRPEVIESYYYAYRATGDPKYQEWAWEAYLAINKTCRVGSGYSSINDVNKVDGGGFQNFQESFWFAEVLKYSYLIHAEVSFACLPFTNFFKSRVFGRERFPRMELLPVRARLLSPCTNTVSRTLPTKSRQTIPTSLYSTPRLIRLGSLAVRAPEGGSKARTWIDNVASAYVCICTHISAYIDYAFNASI